MARIPLYNEGQSVRTAAPGSEQISAGRGVSVENLAGLVEAPLLDPRGAVAEARGFAAVGEGISQVAQPFMELAEQQAKMLNANRVKAARDIMAQAENELAEEQIKEPDETKWIQLAAEKVAKTRERFTGLNLSKAAQDEVDSIYQSWGVSMDGQARVNSARKTRADFKDNQMGIFRSSVLNADLDTANSAIKVLEDTGEIQPGEADELRASAKNGVEAARKRQRADQLEAFKGEVISISRTQPPEDVRKFIENDYAGHGYTPEEKQYLLGVSGQVERDETSNLAGQVLDGIYSDEAPIWNEYELEATYGNSPFMTPRLKERLMDAIRQKNAEVERGAYEAKKAARQGESGTKAFYSAYHDALSWRPNMADEDSAVELADKLAWVRENVRDDLQGEVSSILHQKFGVTGTGKKSGSGSDNPVQKVVTSRIGDIFKNEMALVNEEIDNLERKSTTKPLGAPEDDPQLIAARKKKDDYVEMQARLKDGMDDFFESNPDASRKDAIKHLNTLIPAEKAILDADAIRGERGDAGASGEEGVLGDELIGMVKELEGFNPKPFGDYKQTSIGYGTRAKKGDVSLTEEQADKRLREELAMHASRIDQAAAAGGYKLTERQRDVLISFDFNTGSGAYLLETSGGDLSTIAKRMRQYRIAGGKVNQGLVNRRNREVGIFEKDI